MSMRKRGRIVITLLLLAILYRWKFHYMVNDGTDEPSAIDRIIGRTQSGDTTSGNQEIDVESDASNMPQYAGGGTYATFSTDAVNNALRNNQRVIIVFERSGDPTSLVLHEDIVLRSARIPKDTVILFANVDTESDIMGRLAIDRPNTIIYLGNRGQEIRRKGNGIVTLSQIVSGIDNLQ